MTKTLNHINAYADLTAYNNDKDKNYPNIAYIQETNEVKWVKEKPVIVEGIVVCKYNVTSTSEETFILGTTTGIKYQIIDDVKQDTVKDAYTFDTLGEHTAKYQFDGTSISDRAFEGCTDLTSVSIDNSVTSIGGFAFSSCEGLTSVTIPNSVTEIGEDAFVSCSGLTSIIIPDSVNSIGGGAFQECSGLTSIIIPDSVNSIGDGSFSNCSGLTSITIGNGVTSIGNNSFGECSSLTSIVIPNSVTSISKYAFYNCSGLTSVTIEATTPPTLGGTTAFTNTNNCPIYVPAESLNTYKQASNWSELASRIQSIVA